MDVVLHIPTWEEDYGKSSEKEIVFNCTTCSHNTYRMKRADWDKGKLPPTSPHFPH